MHNRNDRKNYTLDDVSDLIDILNQGNPQNFLEALEDYPDIENHVATGVNFLTSPNVPDFLEKHKAYCLHAALCHDIHKLDSSLIDKAIESLKHQFKTATNLLSTIKTVLGMQGDATGQVLNITEGCYHNFAGAKLPGIAIGPKKMPYACFNHSNISDGFLNGTDLQHSSMRFCNAKKTGWHDANVGGADLTGIELEGAQLIDVQFFTDVEANDSASFKKALDRWYDMFVTNDPSANHWYNPLVLKCHPQFSEIRKAMTANIVKIINSLDNEFIKEDFRKAACTHPMINQHRDFTRIRGAINSVITLFPRKDDKILPIETESAQIIRTAGLRVKPGL